MLRRCMCDAHEALQLVVPIQYMQLYAGMAMQPIRAGKSAINTSRVCLHTHTTSAAPYVLQKVRTSAVTPKADGMPSDAAQPVLPPDLHSSPGQKCMRRAPASDAAPKWDAVLKVRSMKTAAVCCPPAWLKMCYMPTEEALFMTTKGPGQCGNPSQSKG